MKDRAEVISYNQCFGNTKELIQQFNEVRQLNPGLSKPVLHITLSLSRGESLPIHKLAEMAEDCAHDLGFSNSQYVAVLHKDREHRISILLLTGLAMTEKPLAMVTTT